MGGEMRKEAFAGLAGLVGDELEADALGSEALRSLVVRLTRACLKSGNFARPPESSEPFVEGRMLTVFGFPFRVPNLR